MLTAIIHEADIGKMEALCIKATNGAAHGAQCLEWRLDALENIDLSALKKLRAKFNLPIIFTLRSKAEGGSYSGSEDERLTMLMQLATLKPEYIDIEQHVPHAFIESMKTAHPDIKIIRSSHDFNETPKDLNSILAKIKHPACDIYKIITTANSSLDCLKVLSFIKNNALETAMVCHAMGKYGEPSRVLGAGFGNKFTYASAKKGGELKTSLGVLSLNILSKLYRVKSLNADSSIYALIGSPVSNSVGHVFHNHVFKLNGKNSVYVKFDVKENEVKGFLSYAKELGFKGISITMPLKETILPFIGDCKSDVGAVNTLVSIKNSWQGSNTDGMAAINCLEAGEVLKDKKLLIIGAGGAALAIAHEAHSRGIKLTIINRSVDKAKTLATPLNATAYGLNDEDWRQNKYDAIINTLPPKVSQAMAWHNVLKATSHAKTIVMDISYKPRIGIMLTEARKLNLKIISGRAMFIGQAELQQQVWAKN